MRWHRQHRAPGRSCLLTLHAAADHGRLRRADRTGLLRQLWLLLTTYPDVLAAAVGLGLLIMAGVVSFRSVRAPACPLRDLVVRPPVHLSGRGAGLRPPTGQRGVVRRPSPRPGGLGRAVGGTAGTVLVCRLGLPRLAHAAPSAARWWRYAEEGPGVVSVICSGRHLERLAVSGGQFFQWRFLVRGLWWQAHPYSLSALPRRPYLRVTVKGLGDQSRALARIPHGTRVAIEGPYGLFTDHARRRGRVLLVAAGVGITPIRALLEDLPDGVDVA